MDGLLNLLPLYTENVEGEHNLGQFLETCRIHQSFSEFTNDNDLQHAVAVVNSKLNTSESRLAFLWPSFLFCAFFNFSSLQERRSAPPRCSRNSMWNRHLHIQLCLLDPTSHALAARSYQIQFRANCLCCPGWASILVSGSHSSSITKINNLFGCLQVSCLRSHPSFQMSHDNSVPP